MERVIRYDYRELVPLLRHRYDPQNPAVRSVLDRPRDVHMSIDARLRSAGGRRSCASSCRPRSRTKARRWCMDPATGDLLAAVSLPCRRMSRPRAAAADAAPNRARSQPLSGSRALRPVSARLHFQSGHRHGRAAQRSAAGAQDLRSASACPTAAWAITSKARSGPSATTSRTTTPHGTVDMERGIVVSCNAYFAQLGTYDVGAEPLFDTANLLGILPASPNTAAQLQQIAAAIVLRAGAGGGLAVPDGARGGDRGQWRRHAAGPLDHR